MARRASECHSYPVQTARRHRALAICHTNFVPQKSLVCPDAQFLPVNARKKAPVIPAFLDCSFSSGTPHFFVPLWTSTKSRMGDEAQRDGGAATGPTRKSARKVSGVRLAFVPNLRRSKRYRGVCTDALYMSCAERWCRGCRPSHAPALSQPRHRVSYSM